MRARRGFGRVVRLGGATALGVALLLALAVPARAAISRERVIGGLHQAVAFTFDPKGRVYVVDKERGTIQVFNLQTGRDRVFFRLTHVHAEQEQGLDGIAVDPRFPRRPFVYAFATREVDGHLRDQILRIRSVEGEGTRPKVIYSSKASALHEHSGGRLLFGPDGMLYTVIGDAHVEANAQSLTNTRGKVLRMTPAGKVPADNPFAGSLIWAYGIRNSFGSTFDPETGSLWESENGPSCNDEINRIVPGGNYGWGPSETCSGSDPGNTNQDGPSPIQPERWYTPTIAPTGAAFCEGCHLGAATEGTLLFGTFNTGEVRRVQLSGDRQHAVADDVALAPGGIVLSMETGPDGTIYYSTYLGIFALVKT